MAEALRASAAAIIPYLSFMVSPGQCECENAKHKCNSRAGRPGVSRGWAGAAAGGPKGARRRRRCIPRHPDAGDPISASPGRHRASGQLPGADAAAGGGRRHRGQGGAGRGGAGGQRPGGRLRRRGAPARARGRAGHHHQLRLSGAVPARVAGRGARAAGDVEPGAAAGAAGRRAPGRPAHDQCVQPGTGAPGRRRASPPSAWPT